MSFSSSVLIFLYWTNIDLDRIWGMLECSFDLLTEFGVLTKARGGFQLQTTPQQNQLMCVEFLHRCQLGLNEEFIVVSIPIWQR